MGCSRGGWGRGATAIADHPSNEGWRDEGQHDENEDAHYPEDYGERTVSIKHDRVDQTVIAPALGADNNSFGLARKWPAIR